jgi:hypothetical protein
MPLLFWMPMIILFGMWDAAEQSAQDIMKAGEPRS